MATPTPPSRLAHGELATPREMYDDCRAVSRNLGLSPLERAARAAVRPAPSIRFEDYPPELGKREIRITEATARLADALHLHLH